MDEKELLTRLHQQEESAFRELVEGWKDRVYNTALGLLHQEEDAADITQEVFIAAWNGLNKFRGESTINTWLYRIAVTKSLDLIKHRKRKKRFAFIKSIWGIDDRLETDAPHFNHPGVQLEKKQEAAILFEAISKLGDQQRIAYTLHKVEGLSYAEVGVVMNLSIGSVEALIHRAKANLKKSLIDYYKSMK